jgi:hypothetical protein
LADNDDVGESFCGAVNINKKYKLWGFVSYQSVSSSMKCFALGMKAALDIADFECSTWELQKSVPHFLSTARAQRSDLFDHLSLIVCRFKLIVKQAWISTHEALLRYSRQHWVGCSSLSNAPPPQPPKTTSPTPPASAPYQPH